jgi:4-diphosphocytidyl-2-C-methyl-D-erythritol kinase
MMIQAHAKLNLYLEVLGKIQDGYHELESQVVFLNLSDELGFEAAENLQIIGADIEDNIILKTAKKLQEEFRISIGAKIYLKKNIPLAAGLGGGSADAAATIYGLQKLWNFECDKSKLYDIAKQIGADVPCCLYSLLQGKNSVKFAGIGEKLTTADAPKNLYFLLVNPLIKLSTAEVFAKISEYYPAGNSDNFVQRRNDLEIPAKKLMPEIEGILQSLSKQKNCNLARMTGSGATCFGVFNNPMDAKLAEENLKTNFPNYWVHSTGLK